MEQVLERQADGSYRIIEAAPKAELHQDKPGDARSILAKLGMSAEEIDKMVGGPAKTANMEASIAVLDKITNVEIAGIPVGAAAMGAGMTILLDRFVIARLDPQGKWGIWANLGMALVLKKWAGKYIGEKTADAAALFLTYEAVADYVTQAINKVLPPKATAQQAGGSVMQQASRVASDYYASAFGR